MAVPVYWAVGLAPTAYQFFTYLLIIIVNATTANNLGFCIGAVAPNQTVGQIIMPLIVLFMMCVLIVWCRLLCLCSFRAC